MNLGMCMSEEKKEHASTGLNPLHCAKNYGFSPHELNEIRRLIQSNYVIILEAWREHCE